MAAALNVKIVTQEEEEGGGGKTVVVLSVRIFTSRRINSDRHD